MALKLPTNGSPKKRAAPKQAAAPAKAPKVNKAAAKAAKAVKTAKAAAKPATKAKPASSAVPPSPSKMTAKQVADETLRLARGGGEQHRQGEVVNRGRCNVKDCRQPNARLGCKLCRIHLCSPECYNAHVFDNAELTGACSATFLEISKFKQKQTQENKAHRKATAAAPAAATAGRSSRRRS